MRARAASKLSKKIWGWKGREFSFEYSYLTLKDTIWSLLRLYFAPKEDFFSDWLCHFKGLFVPVWREIHLSKILPVTSWQLTNRTVRDISRCSRLIICQSFFFPPEFLIWFKSIQAKQVDHETSSLARSLRDLMHRSSFSSHLRTYEKSTCSKSIPGTIK